MPIYMPWLTVTTALLIVLGTLTNNTEIWLVSAYLVLPITLVILHCLSIVRLSKSILVLSSVPIFSYVYAQYRTPAAATNDLSNYLNKQVVFTGSFIDIPETHNPGTVNCFTKIKALSLDFPEHKPLTGKAQLLIINSKINNPYPYQLNQIIQVKGKVLALDHIQEPWLGGVARAAKQNGIFCQVRAYAQNITVLEKPDSNDQLSNAVLGLTIRPTIYFIDQLRKKITDVHLLFLGNKAGGLLASMVLGDRAVSLDKELLNIFRKIGLSHIVAASGFNLSIVTVITYSFLRILSIRKQMTTFLVCGNVIFYSLIAGLSASIIRASIACLLLLIVHYHHRSLHNMAALSVALIINLIIDPKVVLEPGAQLSYAAVAGIIFGADSICKALSVSSKNKVVRIFAVSFSVILIAQISVLPIQLYHFWQASLLFLPANLIIDPLVTPVTILGFAASLAGMLSLPLCQGLDWLAAIPLQIIIYIAEKLAASDLSVINTGQPSVMVIITYYLTLIFFLICLTREKLRLFGTGIFLFGLITLFYKPDLKQATIIVSPRSIVVINTHRQAIYFGNDALKSNKILAFYGASLFDQTELAKFPDPPYQFSLSSRQETIQLPMTRKVSQEPDNNLYLFITRSGLANSDKKYLIICGSHSLSSNQGLSSILVNASKIPPSKFTQELTGIDFKICCPHKLISFYSLSTWNDAQNSIYPHSFSNCF